MTFQESDGIRVQGMTGWWLVGGLEPVFFMVILDYGGKFSIPTDEVSDFSVGIPPTGWNCQTISIQTQPPSPQSSMLMYVHVAWAALATTDKDIKPSTSLLLSAETLRFCVARFEYCVQLLWRKPRGSHFVQLFGCTHLSDQMCLSMFLLNMLDIRERIWSATMFKNVAQDIF